MSGEVEIRRAVPGDEQAIADVLLAGFSVFRSEYTPQAFAVVTPGADEIAGRFSGGAMWVAEIAGEIVGTASVLPEPEWLYIRSVAVLPAAQGKGVGRLLMNAIEKYALENGFARMFLYTTYFSTGAIGMYEKLGFKRGRDTTAEEWYGTPGLAMDKILQGNTKQNVVGS